MLHQAEGDFYKPILNAELRGNQNRKSIIDRANSPKNLKLFLISRQNRQFWANNLHPL